MWKRWPKLINICSMLSILFEVFFSSSWAVLFWCDSKMTAMSIITRSMRHTNLWFSVLWHLSLLAGSWWILPVLIPRSFMILMMKKESAKCNSRYTLYAVAMNYSAFRQYHKCLTLSIFCTFKRLQSDLSSLWVPNILQRALGFVSQEGNRCHFLHWQLAYMWVTSRDWS